MDKTEFKTYQDRLFQTKTKSEWDSVCNEIKEVTENDEQARIALRNYLIKIKDKKFEYFEKYPPKEKKQFPIKKTVLIDESLSKTIEQYYSLLILEKKLEIKNKFNIDI